MEWIKTPAHLPHDREIILISRDLNIHQTHVVGIITTLRCHVISHFEEGDISEWNAEQIKYYCGWDGDADALFNALNNRIFELRGHRLVMCDWLDLSLPYFKAKYHTSDKEKLKEIKQNLAYSLSDVLTKSSKRK